MRAYFAAASAAPPPDYRACSGCSLCLVVCPLWRRSHDPRLSAEGIAKALQCGATATQLAEPIAACSLCGACDPVCPEGIDLSGLIAGLRRQLAGPGRFDDSFARLRQGAVPGARAAAKPAASAVLLPGRGLRNDGALLARIQALLGVAIADDDGDDIALALEAGADIPPPRLQQFLGPLRGRRIVVADGLLLRYLGRWLPGSKPAGIGAALSSMAPVRGQLRASDLYVIEPRAYHADYERLVTHYDQLRKTTDCTLNLDLQRIAIPALTPALPEKYGRRAGDDAVQAKWILQGRNPARIVVESLADRAAFAQVCDIPVVYLADVAEG